MSDWIHPILHPRDQEPVNAAVAGRASRALEQRTGYLKDALEFAELGSALVVRDAALAPGTAVGPVYYDIVGHRFAPALATLAATPGGGYRPAASAQVRGVCVAVRSETMGTVLVAGRALADLRPAMLDHTLPGLLYLSNIQPGKLVHDPPPFAVPVGFWTGTEFFLDSRCPGPDHIHDQIELTCLPAGAHAPPAPGGTHAIDDPDPALPGWLPADHASFGGQAPPGAVFGYNLAADPAALARWPALPPGTVSLIWDTGDGDDGRVLLAGDLYTLDAAGLWWHSDAYGRVPWPVDLDTAGGSSLEGSSVAPTAMRLVLAYALLPLATDRALVTSLAGVAPIEVLDCVTLDPATSGALRVQLDLPGLLGDDETMAGGLALKGIGDSGKFERGPVLTRAKAGAGIVLDSDGGPDSEGWHTGEGLVIATAAAGAELVLAPTVVRVDNAELRYDDLVPAYGFPAGRASQLQLLFDLPNLGLPAGGLAKLRLWVRNDAAGTLPALAAERLILARPLTATALPTAWTSLVLPAAGAMGADEYLEQESATFAITAGAQVAVVIDRPADDGYAGEIGLLRAVLVLV